MTENKTANMERLLVQGIAGVDAMQTDSRYSSREESERREMRYGWQLMLKDIRREMETKGGSDLVD